ncbi:Uncharacterised protein [Mycobacterium tuberculosis]|nr:Uncharacterised protein [Mycobacterium tuberculosis]
MTLSIWPPDSSAAATAVFQLAGLPIRIAVATVSGCSTRSPRTMAAAPSASNPHMHGNFPLRPASRYSRNPFQ